MIMKSLIEKSKNSKSANDKNGINNNVKIKNMYRL